MKRAQSFQAANVDSKPPREIAKMDLNDSKQTSTAPDAGNAASDEAGLTSLNFKEFNAHLQTHLDTLKKIDDLRLSQRRDQDVWQEGGRRERGRRDDGRENFSEEFSDPYPPQNAESRSDRYSQQFEEHSANDTETGHTTRSNNPVVDRCYWSYVQTMANWGQPAEGQDIASSHRERDIAATKAFRASMPPLSGYSNIRDFVACVAHGVLIEVIPSDVASRLLYAAQVAHCTAKIHPSERRKPNRMS